MLPVTSKRSALGPALCDLHALRSGGSVGRLACERDLDRLRGEVAQLCEGALVDEPSASEDADAVAQRLDLAEDVRGEEDGLPALLGLAYALAEGDLHQGVKAAGRLVEQQQIGAGGERRDQLHLLAVALRQRPDLL